MSQRIFADGEAWLVAGIVVLWLAACALVLPVGEFPLNDDWAYARSVQALLERGEIERRPWTPAITLSHTLFGAFASALFGFSFETLHASMLVLGLAGVLALYGLLRELGAPSGAAAVGAASLALNPIYFQLSVTFMTDVSFFVQSTIALWAFARALRTGSRAAIAVGALASLAATLNRQIGVALPFGFALGGLWGVVRREPSRASGRAGWPWLLAPLALSVAALFLWEAAMAAPGVGSSTANVKVDEMLVFLTGTRLEVARRILWNVLGHALYLGLFALPFALVVAGARLRAGVLGAVALAATAWLAWRGEAMPLVGNIVLPSGLGPATLRDTHILMRPSLPEAPWLVRLAATAASAFGAALVVRLLLGRRTHVRVPARGARALLLASVGLLFAGPNLIAPYFDRYLLPLVPIVLGGLALRVSAGASASSAEPAGTGAGTGARAAAAAWLALGLVLSVAGTHDYLAWSRARWGALEWLVRERGAKLDSIDGGFEWNGWHRYDPKYFVRPDKSWWWVEDDRWVATFGPLEGYEVVHRAPFGRWLPPFGEGQVLVLERSSDAAP